MDEPTKLIYGKEPHLIKKNTYKNYNYFIIKNQIGPCAYVEIGKDPNWDVFELNSPHGGLTYCQQGLELYFSETDFVTFVKENVVIGWDYMHADDYLPTFGNLGFNTDSATVWSVSMIEQDCKNTIDEIVNRNLQLDR